MTYQVPAILPGDDWMQAPVLADPAIALRRDFRLGLLVVALFVVSVLLISALAQSTGAVIGSGEVTVESRIKKVAHPTGGVIAEILVHEGSRVKRGQPLIRLDTSVSGASAIATGDSVEQLTASVARLTAQRDGLSAIVFPAALTTNPTPAKTFAMEEARRLFLLQQQAIGQQTAQVAERVRQTEQQIGAYAAQRAATQKQVALVRPELDGLRDLRAKQLVTVNRLNQTERAAVDLEGSAAAFSAQIAESRARIAELRQSASQIVQDARSRAGAELVEVQQRLSDQRIKSAGATDAYNRSVIRAPVDGVVEKLNGTAGGVIAPTETVMEIVPTGDQLTVSARVSPTDIDQLYVGQPTRLHFSAFNSRTTPQIEGKVRHISTERLTDERTGQSYYKVEAEVSPGEIRKLGGLKLVPGMPVEAFMQTNSRSLLSYLFKPLADQFARAFREG